MGRPRLKSYVSNPIPQQKKSHHNKPHHKSHHSHYNLHHNLHNSGNISTPSCKTTPIKINPTYTIPTQTTLTSTQPACDSLLPNTLSPQKLFSWSQSENRPFPKKDSKAHHRVKSALADEGHKELLGMALYSTEAKELPSDFQLCRTLKPLIEFTKIKNKKISNPYLFRSVPIVTTFVCSAGSCTQGVWCFLEKASWVDIRLAELEHPSLTKMSFL